MTVTECYDMNQILHETEAAFQIDGRDYEESDIDEVIASVKQRLRRTTGLDFVSYQVGDPELSIMENRAKISMLTSSIALVHSKLCGLIHINRFLTQSDISLQSVNYLGYRIEDVKTALRVLQRKATQPRKENVIQMFKDKLPVLGSCNEKRFIMVLVVADALGYKEIVAAIAELLFQATL